MQRYCFNLTCARKAGYLTFGVVGWALEAVKQAVEALVLHAEVMVLRAEVMLLHVEITRRIYGACKHLTISHLRALAEKTIVTTWTTFIFFSSFHLPLIFDGVFNISRNYKQKPRIILFYACQAKPV